MKKLHKTGIAIISALAPACALGITAGVVVASLPKQAVEEIVLEELHGGLGFKKDGVSIKGNIQYKVIIDYKGIAGKTNGFALALTDKDVTEYYTDKIESISGKDGTGEMTFQYSDDVYYVEFHNPTKSQKITINMVLKQDIDDVSVIAEFGGLINKF